MGILGDAGKEPSWYENHARLTNEQMEALERARVVGVLDAWADKHECATPEVTRLLNKSKEGQFRVWLLGHVVYGKTRDAARAAAAKAIEAGEV